MVNLRNVAITTAVTLSCLSVTSALMAQEQVTDEAKNKDSDNIETIRVWGRATDLIGAADSASEGLVGYDDFSTRPLLRVGEMVEVMPGMIATQHSGGGKANQYFLRGINLDHGTDFGLNFEGMPSNMRTHAHGQGYLDMNFIIPELIETIEYNKGTYHAANGDFSAAGSTKFKTYSTLKSGFVHLIIGTEKYQRLVAANAWDTSDGTMLVGGEMQYKDGPWANPEDVKKYNFMTKYTTEINGKEASLLATYYDNTWSSTDQIPSRAVVSGDIDRFGFIDPTTGGQSKRANLIANLEQGATNYSAFATYYELNLFSNGTYFLADQVNGDQIEQEDQRIIVGASVNNKLSIEFDEFSTTLSSGADFRYDDINKLNLFNTHARQRVNTVRSDKAEELSVGAYLNYEMYWTESLRTTVGVRADFFSWDVNALIDENSGSGSDYLIAPKFGAVYTLTDTFEVYANYGKGFHSNDVRAVELSVDPVTGDPAEPFDAIVDAMGYEIGLRAEPNDELNYSVSIFYLEFDSELIFVGDAGATEPNDATERYGIEATVFWQPTDWLTFDLTGAKTEAEFKVSGYKIPDAHDMVAGAGITVTLDNGFTGSIRVRHFSDAPLNDDGSIEKAATTLVNLGISYKVNRHLTVGLDLLNMFDSKEHDIEYFYESQLANESSPVEDVHFHPVEPREVRLNLQYNF